MTDPTAATAAKAIDWRESYPEARAAARDERRPLLAFLWAPG